MIAKVIPVYKSGDESDPSNYRPISLFSIFNLVFEKVMYHRLKSVIEKCNISDPKAIANAFNNYFANVGGNLASSIPSASKTANEFMPPPMCDSLFLYPVTADEI